MTLKLHLAILPLWSSAEYLTNVCPMGNRFGGTTAGTVFMVGMRPELSSANGTTQSISLSLSNSSASVSTSAGHVR